MSKRNQSIMLVSTVFATCVAISVASAATPDYENDIAPILNKYCVGCHSTDEPEADLVLESFDALMKGGENGSTINSKELANSLLVRRVIDADDPMPPEGEPQPSKQEVAKLIAWVKAGAKNSAVKNDPQPTRFDRIKSVSGPKPITAIAYTLGDGITLVGDLKVSGVDIQSLQGFLVPVPDPPGAAPFTFLLANQPTQITWANLGRETDIDGELHLQAEYKGPKDGEDLKVTWGIGAQPAEAKYRFREIVAVGRFGSVEVYNEDSAEPEWELKTPGKVHGLQFTRDGKHLVAASGVAGVRGEAILWDVVGGKVAQRFQGHRDAIYAVALSDNGKRVATGSYDRQIIVWDTESGEQLRTLKGHNGAIYDLDFSPDGKVLASASADATVKIWNVNSGKRLDTLGQPLKEQYSVDISPDGKRVIAGGEDNRIRMWNLVSIGSAKINPIVEARFAHEAAVENVHYSRDGKRIVSSSTDGTIKVWDASKLELLSAYDKPKNATDALALSTDDHRISIGKLNGTLAAFPLQEKQTIAATTNQVAVKARIVSGKEVTEYEDAEPNGKPETAQTVSLPATVTGVIHGDNEVADHDLFKFKARAGEKWIVEVKAARDESPLDSHVAILHADGSPVPRVQLQATRDSYFTFRGKDSNGTGDFRVHNWEEMQLNQFLYSAGEVVKLFHYPRGPDSGFNVYPNFGKRYGFFDTTPMAHALHEPAYIVEPHPPGVKLPANGLPVFVLNYENDDESFRRLGKDSRLTFVAPKDGEYLVALRDVRGQQGEDFKYTLMVRPPKPNFKGKVLDKDPKVAKGTGRKFGIEVERIDGFDGPIDVEISNLPPGFSVPGPLQVEPHHDRLWATLMVDEDAATPTETQMESVKVTLSASIRDELVNHELGSLGKITLEEEPKLLVELVPDQKPAAGSLDYPVIGLRAGESTTATIKITRKNHDGRVGFGNESGAVNAPHGVYVDNIGLNGVLIVEGQNERQFFLTAEPWVKPMERVMFVESGDAGKPTSNPVILRILPAAKPAATDQALRQ